MLSPETITSLQNPKVKDLVVLEEKSRERKERGLFVVEGEREFTRALKGGFVPESIFFCDKYISVESLRSLVGDFEVKLYSVSAQVYEKLAWRGGTEGVVATLKIPDRKLEEFVPCGRPLVLVLESVEKPGNIGAVLRTADAAGVDAVIVCDPLTDLYNPNVVRASLGAIFSVPAFACTSEEALEWIRRNGLQVLTAQLQDSNLYYDTDMTGPIAIVFGTEDKGLTDFWRKESDARIRIPMAGMMDSLNVSVSAAILCFEAVRQRGRA
jgi:rRNA methylases